MHISIRPNLDASWVLEQLLSCNSFGTLYHQCETQRPYMSLIRGHRRALSIDRLVPDSFAVGFIPKDLKTHNQLFAAKVRMDGDCLPGSGSVFAFGSDKESDLIRLHIVHELVLHSIYYLHEENLLKGYTEKTSKDELVKAFAMYSEKFIPGRPFNVQNIYLQETLGLLDPKSYMGIWQIFALSSVLRMKIFSVYLLLGNPSVRKHLHRIIVPRVESTTDVGYIMWTSTRSKSCYNWLPNHFVPLLPFM